jgi:hypothetical protein
MNWFKVVIGFVIMIGILVVWFRFMGSMRGDGGSSGLKLEKIGRRKERPGSNELEQIIAAHRTGGAPASTPSTPAVAATPPAAPSADPEPAAPALPVPAASQASSPALLQGPLKLTYLLVRSTFPELLVFPNVSASRLGGIASVAPGRDRVFDLVLCRQDFTPVAVVMLREGGLPGTSPEALLLGPEIQCLDLDPRHLPRREQLRPRLRRI